MQTLGKHARRAWIAIGGFAAFFAALTPFVKVVPGTPIPGTIFLFAGLAVVGWISVWYSKARDRFEPLPTKDAEIFRWHGRWYALVSWRLPVREWNWPRVRRPRELTTVVFASGFFVAGWVVVVLTSGFDPLVFTVFMGMAALMAAMTTISVAGYEMVAVGLG